MLDTRVNDVQHQSLIFQPHFSEVCTCEQIDMRSNPSSSRTKITDVYNLATSLLSLECLNSMQWGVVGYLSF